MAQVEIFLDSKHSAPEGVIAYRKVDTSIMVDLPIELLASELIAFCNAHTIGYWREHNRKVHISLTHSQDVDSIANELMELIHAIHTRSTLSS